ncbi:hypothetical protein Vretifemale_14269, partial [Volvox reticuliferus]
KAFVNKRCNLCIFKRYRYGKHQTVVVATSKEHGAMVSEPSAVLRTSVWIPRPGKAADLSTEEKRKQSVAAVWRGFYSRWEGPAAETIQKWWRGHAARRFVQALRHGRLLVNGAPEHVEETAAVVIQRYWRGFLDRQKAAELHKAVVDIQRWWKGYRARKEWPRLRLRWRARNYDAATIQRWVRGHLARKRVRRMREEGLQQQQQQREQGSASAERLQNHGSMCSAAVAAGGAGESLREAAATVIQAHWKGRQARKRRAWLQREAAKRKRYEKRLAAAKVIQSYFRGWYVRKAIARLRVGGPLQPGSLAGGVVAAPGIAGDVQTTVLVPYGYYDDDDEDDDGTGGQCFQRPVPHGHPTPPPMPRAVAPPAVRMHMVRGGGGTTGGAQGVRGRAWQNAAASKGASTRTPAVAAAAATTTAGAVTVAPGTRTAPPCTANATTTTTSVNVRPASQLRSMPPPPPSPAHSSLRPSPVSIAAQSGVRRIVGPPRPLMPAGSALASIRAVRAAAGAGTSSESASHPQQQCAVQLSGIDDRKVRPAVQNPPPPSASSTPGPLRAPPGTSSGKLPPPPPSDKSAITAAPSPGPLRSAGVSSGGAVHATVSQPPPSPVTPPRGPQQRSRPVVGGGHGRSGTVGRTVSYGTKPATAPVPLGRALSLSSSGGGGGGGGVGGAVSSTVWNLGELRVRPPATEGSDGALTDSPISPRMRPFGAAAAAAAAGSGVTSSAFQTSHTTPRAGAAPAPLSTSCTSISNASPQPSRSDLMRASAPEPLRATISAEGKDARAAVPSATVRRRAWDSEGAAPTFAAAAATAAVSAAAEPQTPGRRTSGSVTTATTAHDAASNPLHDQVMRANRGGRVVNGAVSRAAAASAAAAPQRRQGAR